MRRQKLPLLLTCVLLFHVLILAQDLTPVNIVVTDPGTAPISGARIRLVPSPDAAANEMQTDSKGYLRLGLKPGGYALFVRIPGFKTYTGHFDVRGNQQGQTVSVVLQLADVSGPVEVTTTGETGGLLLLAYPYHDPERMAASGLKAMPHISVTIHNPHTNADETYSGVRLADLLSKMGAPLGDELHGEALANYIVATGSDGYQAVLALGEIDPSFHPGEVLVADTMNGKPLDEHSGPLKLVVTEDKWPARSVRNLISIQLKGVN
ncbi:MAG TPA: carboxypeptidase regulatory-like domain-containing protein [Candidatus Sulfotelmatobacter sp.]